MIVMKFGGSSVESGSAIRRVAAIVKDHLSRNPVVVVSAMGKTTSRLLELAREAARGHACFVTQHLSGLQDYHFDEAADAVSGEPLERLEASLQRHFRDLRTLLSEIAEDNRELTPALLDEIASYGEQMSSQVLASALESAGIPSLHVDARRLILTDDRHTQATPLYWETYAKLRRATELYSGRVPVMGGFIASSASGATTTIGRGGSDLSASIVGAGISAEEIQIWTDVDGMLTTDPRIGAEFYRLRSLSYEEAAEMARAGAKVLHPDSVAPAIRQRIPIVIRNSRNPQNEGTRIVPGASGSGMVKSIACRPDLLVLEVPSNALTQFCDGSGASPEWIGGQEDAAFLAVREAATPDRPPAPFDGCVQVFRHSPTIGGADVGRRSHRGRSRPLRAGEGRIKADSGDGPVGAPIRARARRRGSAIGAVAIRGAAAPRIFRPARCVVIRPLPRGGRRRYRFAIGTNSLASRPV